MWLKRARVEVTIVDLALSVLPSLRGWLLLLLSNLDLVATRDEPREQCPLLLGISMIVGMESKMSLGRSISARGGANEEKQGDET